MGQGMYSGLIVKESLKNFQLLEDKDIKVSRIEKCDLGERAADFQPNTWTAVFIEGKEERIEQVDRNSGNEI